jgi:FMN phosphatase YigB (HAD superfamily)
VEAASCAVSEGFDILEVPASEAIFVGDDLRWDVLDAESVGFHPLLLLNGSAVGSSWCTVITRREDVLSWIKVAG